MHTTQYQSFQRSSLVDVSNEDSGLSDSVITDVKRIQPGVLSEEPWDRIRVKLCQVRVKLGSIL
jgi:hypothetical protein